MPRPLRFWLPGLIALISWAGVAAVAASTGEEPRIRDVRIAIAGGEILLSFRLEDGFTPEVRERIASGLPTSLTYELELMRDRKRWWDRGMEASRLEVVAMYNAVTREYLVNTKHDGKLIGSRTVRDFDELERVMTEFVAFPAFALEAEPSRSRYLVRVRVDLGSGAVLGFIPVQRATPWIESNKVRFQTPAS
jgi:hypothetical protein